MEENPYNADGVNLPVFGLKNGASAFLAVIEKGDALANVGARSSGSTTSYNTVYAEFRVREKAVQTIGGTDNVQNIYQQERYKGAFSVSYRFLSGEDAGYVGMAKAYRATLFDGQSAPIREKRPLYLELIGAIDVTENVAGIPVGKTRALTSFEEAAAILEELGASGADLSSAVVRYSGLWNGGHAAGIRRPAACCGSAWRSGGVCLPARYRRVHGCRTVSGYRSSIRLPQFPLRFV